MLRGRVTVGEARGLPGATVVLHRVDPLDAGEVDSLRADDEGRFRFRLPTVPDPGGRGEVYFASVRHQGVLYFGPPVATAAELDSLYRILVHDTAVVARSGAPLVPTVRYLLVEEAANGWQVTDLFQLVVEGERTLVAADSGVTWRYPLPPGHRNLQVGGGDVPAGAARVEDGDLLVSAPLPPGPRQLIVRYQLDSLAFDIPLPGGVEEMDVLVREPAPPVEVEGLTATESVELEPGARYRRYAGVGVPDAVLRLRALPAERPFPVAWVAVALGLLLAVVGGVVIQRTPARGAPAARTASAPSPEGGSREELVRQIALLDEALEGLPPGGERERLRHRRRALVNLLRARA
ncbi:MAG: hypothetical protein RQ751_11345 [Longimicrobiales bacterium]|nr:hypothetical protein [Longimicrobiales bacterium]